MTTPARRITSSRPISEDDYFALTDEEKWEVPRDARGLPFGYWTWSKEAWNRYGQENPRTPDAGRPRPPPQQPEKEPIPILGFNPVDWEGKKAPPRKSIVPDYIPDETVTLLYADGGTGKSYLKLQLAVARALAKEWIGLLPEPGRTLVLSTEDDLDEMWRRIEGMLPFFAARMADLGDIRLVDLVGENSILGLLTRGIIESTPIYAALDAYIAEFQPGLVELDVLADLFSGEENSRPQVTQFIGLLKRLCRKHHCAILLLAQPSVTGMNTGSGTSGSTGWSNSGRSRLYFQRVKTSEGGEPNKNLRTFEGKKANYSEVGGKFDVEWKDGLFRRVRRVNRVR
jgi:RecA-family ATPase